MENMLSSANAAYILPGTHTVKLQYNRPGGGSIGPVELQFTAEAGHEYIAKWHYSWSNHIITFQSRMRRPVKLLLVVGRPRPNCLK